MRALGRRGVVVASSSRSAGTGGHRAVAKGSGSGECRQNGWYYCKVRRARFQSGGKCSITCMCDRSGRFKVVGRWKWVTQESERAPAVT